MALALAFLLFRVFDILKPWPVRAMERIPGADGILLDDVVAGLYGLACMAALRLLLPGEGLWVYNGA
jgi:phosphatidylglycerophosphatase A